RRWLTGREFLCRSEQDGDRVDRWACCLGFPRFFSATYKRNLAARIARKPGPSLFLPQSPDHRSEVSGPARHGTSPSDRRICHPALTTCANHAALPIRTDADRRDRQPRIVEYAQL